MDKIFSPIKERIMQFIDNEGIIKAVFYGKIKISSSNFKGDGAKSELGGDIIAKILSEYPNLNPEWLLTGKGEMLKKSSPETYINYDRMPAVITVPDEASDVENIEIVPVKLAAGYVGGGYAEKGFIEKLPKFRLPFLRNGTFRCFSIGGHSMDRIQDDDWFIGKFLDNTRKFNEGKVHAVIAPGAESLLIKRIFRHPTDKDMLILRSDNNDISNVYPDIQMHIKYIAELWSYAALISFKEPTYDMEKFKEILNKHPEKVVYK
jgi:hypothetical protein